MDGVVYSGATRGSLILLLLTANGHGRSSVGRQISFEENDTMKRELFVLAFVAYWIGPMAANSEQPRRAYKAKVQIGKDTTYIVGPVDAHGFVDYIAAGNQLLSAGVTPENNAGWAITAAVGPDAISEPYRKEFYSLFNQPVPVKTATDFIAPNVFARENGFNRLEFDDQIEKSMLKPWRETTFPLAAKWLDRNQVALDRIVIAAKLPRYYIPLVAPPGPPTHRTGRMLSVFLFIAEYQRYIGRALAARINRRLHDNQLELAYEDLLTLHRLARHAAQGGFIMDQLIAYKLIEFALHANSAWIAHPNIELKTLRKLQMELCLLPKFPFMADKFNQFERFSLLDCATAFSHSGTQAVLEQGAKSAIDAPWIAWAANTTIKMGTDHNEFLQRTNWWINRGVHAMRQESYSVRQAIWRRILKDIKEVGSQRMNLLPRIQDQYLLTRSYRKAFTIVMSEFITTLLYPDIGGALASEESNQQRLDIIHLSVALAIYRAENGSYPQTLDKLVPRYWSDVPQDRFVNQPLRYRANKSGFLVYSFGSTLKDDQGKSDKPHDDIAARVGDVE